MKLRPEQMCEAKISYRTIDKGAARIVFDFEGRRHDLGPNVTDRPAVEEGTVDCDHCPIKGVVFQAEGGYPFGAINAARKRAAEILKDSCTKLPAVREKGVTQYNGLPTRDFHPNL